MPKCKVNGIEVEVEEGAKLIEAFKKADEGIAHYCWHPGLTVAGVCRLCMVEIDGNPRLQIACNTTVTEGMVASNQSDKVKETVKWGLDFHLINHPLDCPICDQAGECGLQDQYMEFGKYTPEMAERKVKKRKVVSLGEKVVLDTERCILCSRCVRFTSEVTKTNELGIFNRGDRAEIGTFENKPLNNNYSVNTVDICPVGALTSKDFRFRQRVWYMKEADGICTGCSTGCNVKYYYNEEGLHRVKPRFNKDVNGYWMCDKGRDSYKFVNKESRLERSQKGSKGNWSVQDTSTTMTEIRSHLNKLKDGGSKSKVGLVLTGQYTSEEYENLLTYFGNNFSLENVFHWVHNLETMDQFDGILFRGDENPNTIGLISAFESKNIKSAWVQLEAKLNKGEIDTLIVAAPENISAYKDINDKINLFSKAHNLIWLGAVKQMQLEQVTCSSWLVPMKSFFEKSGTYVNFQGTAQKMKAVASINPNALNLTEVSQYLKDEYSPKNSEVLPELNWTKKNFFVHQRGSL